MKFTVKPENSRNIAALLLRLTALIMLTHGWRKLSHFGTNLGEFDDPLHVGHTASKALTVFAEFFCTIFVAAGLYTRIAVIPLIICFAVIVFVVHASSDFGEKELGLVYLCIYLAIFALGPGKFSLDRLIRKIT